MEKRRIKEGFAKTNGPTAVDPEPCPLHASLLILACQGTSGITGEGHRSIARPPTSSRPTQLTFEPLWLQ